MRRFSSILRDPGPAAASAAGVSFSALEPLLDTSGGKGRARGLLALMHVQQHELGGRGRTVDPRAEEIAAGVDALAIEIEHRCRDAQLVGCS